MIARATFSALLLVSVLGCRGGQNGQDGQVPPASCGGTVATQGMVGGVAFAATSINVIGVNGNAIAIYLTDANHDRQLWFTISRSQSTNMFAAGSYQDTAVYESQVGTVTVELTQVVDPFDARGEPLPGPDGGVVGSVEGSFAAQFGADLVSGSFASPVCQVTDLV